MFLKKKKVVYSFVVVEEEAKNFLFIFFLINYNLNEKKEK